MDIIWHCILQQSCPKHLKTKIHQRRQTDTDTVDMILLLQHLLGSPFVEMGGQGP